MQSYKNILILTSKTGGGHVSLAEALQDLLVEYLSVKGEGNPQNSLVPAITIFDPQPSIFHHHYRLVSRYALWLWATEFRLLDTATSASLAHRVFTGLVYHQLLAVLEQVRPDLIITTYPFLTCEVMYILNKRFPTTPLVSLFSDASGVHAAWLTERRAAATLAPTFETYTQALTEGFAPDCLHLVGWPVRTQFARAFQLSSEVRNELLSELQLISDRFTIFLQGGGEGAAHIDRVLQNIQAVNNRTGKIQVILAAGTNRALARRYKDTRHLAVLPYTKEIAPWMAAADVVMGKAGPNMLIESVMLGKPFVATSYIPGQEHANLRFIQHHGLGWVVLHNQEQQALLMSLVRNDNLFHTLSPTINAYRSRNADGTAYIGPLLYSLLRGSV